MITGAAGRLGRSLTHALRDAHDLALLTRPGGHRLDTRSSAVDVRDHTSMRDVVMDFGPDAVIHLAGAAGTGADSDERILQSVNVEGTRSVALAAARAEVPLLIFASSAAVYGDSRPHPLAESDEPGATSAYGSTKLEAEELLATIAADTDMAVVALRVFNIFGPGFSDSLVNRILGATPGDPVRLRHLDAFVRDYVHSSDVVEAVRACLRVGGEFRGPLNIGTGVAVSNRRLVEYFGLRETEEYTLVGGGPSYSVADTTLARSVLGFQPVSMFSTRGMDR